MFPPFAAALFLSCEALSKSVNSQPKTYFGNGSQTNFNRRNIMYKITTYIRGVEFHCRSGLAKDDARDQFAKAVKYASKYSVDRVVLSCNSFGRVAMIEDWSATSTQLPEVKNPFRVTFTRDSSNGSTRFACKRHAIAGYETCKADPETLSVKLEQRICVGMERANRYGRQRPKYVTKLLTEWERPTLVEKIEAGYCYKIHGFKTVLDPDRSAKTAKWYKTEEQAIKAAQSMASRSPDALVVYKAAFIVTDGEVTNVE